MCEFAPSKRYLVLQNLAKIDGYWIKEYKKHATSDNFSWHIEKAWSSSNLCVNSKCLYNVSLFKLLQVLNVVWLLSL